MPEAQVDRLSRRAVDVQGEHAGETRGRGQEERAWERAVAAEEPPGERERERDRGARREAVSLGCAGARRSRGPGRRIRPEEEDRRDSEEGDGGPEDDGSRTGPTGNVKRLERVDRARDSEGREEDDLRGEPAGTESVKVVPRSRDREEKDDERKTREAHERAALRGRAAPEVGAETLFVRDLRSDGAEQRPCIERRASRHVRRELASETRAIGEDDGAS